MYAALPLSRLIKLLLWPFGLTFAVLLVVGGVPRNPVEWFRLVGGVITTFSLLLAALGASSSTWAPWRVIWRSLPFLNEKIFPDLNGIWRGTTSSNWPIISARAGAGLGEPPNKPNDGAGFALQKNEIELEIIANLFVFRITATLPNTNSKSSSLTESFTCDRHGRHEVFYVYRQNTPVPDPTDENAHDGAASLRVDTVQWTLSGAYWTRRSWQKGLNTAGLIEVKRISRDVNRPSTS